MYVCGYVCCVCVYVCVCVCVLFVCICVLVYCVVGVVKCVHATSLNYYLVSSSIGSYILNHSYT